MSVFPNSPQNSIIFELVRIRRKKSDFRVDFSSAPIPKPEVKIFFVHPFLVNPRDIRYSDTSRTSISQSPFVGISNKAGRSLRRVSISGTFGLAPKFVGPGFVDGLDRLKQFWDEIVRLGDAVTKEQVVAAKSPFSFNQQLSAISSSGVSQGVDNLVKGVSPLDDFRPETDVFVVNFYDFMEGISFSCNIDSFTVDKSFSKNRLPRYSIQLTEIGNIVVPNLGGVSGLIHPMSLQHYDNLASNIVNQVQRFSLNNFADLIYEIDTSIGKLLHYFTGDGFENSFKTSLALQGTSFSRPETQIDFAEIDSGREVPLPSAARIIRSAMNATNSAVVSSEKFNDIIPYIGTWRSDLQAKIHQLLDIIENLVLKDQPIELSTEIEISEGFKPKKFTRGISSTNRLKLLSEQFLNIYRAHRLSSAQFEARMANIVQGNLDPELYAPTIEHKISEHEDIFEISNFYDVKFENILLINQLSIDDLTPGLSILVPVRRQDGDTLNSIPTFGDVCGENVYGTDLEDSLTADSDGDLNVLEPIPTLVQGVTNMVFLFSSAILDDKLLELVPSEVLSGFLRFKLNDFILEDRRIFDITDIKIEETDLGMNYELTLQTVTKSQQQVSFSLNE